jgi:hypothetical protein
LLPVHPSDRYGEVGRLVQVQLCQCGIGEKALSEFWLRLQARQQRRVAEYGFPGPAVKRRDGVTGQIGEQLLVPDQLRDCFGIDRGGEFRVVNEQVAELLVAQRRQGAATT